MKHKRATINVLIRNVLCLFLASSIYGNNHTQSTSKTNLSYFSSATCPNDNDCDGILDDIDLDDDNDGILDKNEFNFDANFITNGSARLISGNRYQLTEDKALESGSIMLTNLIDFNYDFNFSLILNFGNKDDDGADGMTLIFHNDPDGLTAIGGGGGSLGTEGISNGLYFEIDTYYNGSPQDLEEDHTSLSDSDFPFSSTDKFVTQPIPFSNLEDGNDHTFSVSWAKSSQTFTFTIDGVIGAQLTGVDVVNKYFDGSSNIYFGIAASTGALTNEHFLEDFFFGDTDQDRVINSFDLDSDNDGCPDVIKSGGDDPDADGILGSLPLVVDSDGLVTSAGSGNGYNGLTSTNNEYKASKIEISEITDGGSIISGNPTKFTAIASLLETEYYTGTAPNTLPDYNHPMSTQSNVGLTYQWYLGDPNSGGVILSSNSIYSGVDADVLSISNTSGLLGNQYFVQVSHPKNSCPKVSSIILKECDIDFSVDTTNLSCATPKGSIKATNQTGGSGNYEYRLDGALIVDWQASDVFPDLILGSYTVHIRDAEDVDCVFSETAVVAHDDIEAGYENTIAKS